MEKRRATINRKTKTAYILEAIDEKLGFVVKESEQITRRLAGWHSQREAKELRKEE